jgi:hypothetical protein
MRPHTFCFLVLTISIFCINLPSGAQTQEPTKTQSALPDPPAEATAPPAAPAKLTKEIIKKAQQAGFRARLSKGAIVYCREESDAVVGTRLKPTRCWTENEFDSYVAQFKSAQQKP